MPTFLQAQLEPQCTYTPCSPHPLLTYLPPLFFQASFPSCPLKFDPIHILLVALLPHLLVTPGPPPSSPTSNCREHETTYTHPHLSGNIREGESWRDMTACWRNHVPGTQTSLRSPLLCWNTTSSSPLTLTKDQACLESAGEPPTVRAAKTRRGARVI